jgi:DNA-binding LacI/PurR family transcriptional regulator
MKKLATRDDVAKEAGVSSAVVSYVLNNTKFVSDEKRKAVLTAVKKLNYFPNQLARGLKTMKSNQIAFVADNFRNDWLSELENILSEKGYYVSMCYTREDDGFIDMLLKRQYEGVFMMTNLLSTQQLNTIAEIGVPIILYRTRNYGDLNSRIVTVAPDYADGVRMSVDYLALKGHKRIGLIPPIRYKTKGITGDDFRVKAYVETMEKHGLPLEESLVCTNTQTLDTILESVFNMITSQGASMRPSAFVVGNDFLAAQIMQHIKHMGLSVPDDIALTGTDNTDIAKITSPQLTTIDFSKTEFAQKVADKMLKLINGETPAGEYLKVSLVIRDSA